MWPTIVFNLSRLRHNLRYVVLTVALPIGFYLLYTHMFSASVEIGGVAWSRYFLVSMAAFGAIGTALNAAGVLTAQDRERGWVRYLRTTPLTSHSYVTAQALTAMATSLIAVFLVGACGAVLNGVAVTAALAWGLGLVWIGSVSFAAIGLMLAIVLDASTISYGVTIIYLAMGMLGGLWTPLTALPPLFARIARWLPSYRMADLGWRALAGRALPGQDFAILAAYFAVGLAVGGVLYARRG